MPEDAQLVFKGAMFDVYQWQQQLYNGQTATFEKIRRPDTVLVIPVMDDGRIVLAEQEQPGVAPFVGALGGRIDPGETVEAAASRELAEEAGMQASGWQLLLASQPSSKIDWAIYTLIAKGCRQIGGQTLDGGEKINLKFLTFEEFVATVTAPTFDDHEIKMEFLQARLDPARLAVLKAALRG
ncbi:MAG: hypothetical protein A2760_02585 [Candidatus Doudnabacteria bacterium RIFCSPHIGHO2_01_FULL_50_67]|uniref:Nudix hydrolase domain-containing protein n=1 Tax=Candidatus Doudnabacteria bacterium RIFCSPHIGHO2_12_FULL_48_16 TaxID=1817838 RepID=A0A1F5PLT4_9BACT|nr:MAG: hypothetical protein A3B77_00410 [Candidatus Doudnabacteria bacterium RIFCSPHIGHO2_02_FULL_49_24]OGE89494.1 MAG: hypothetical protein A2760_02585 [Candidatus Doudnabacteria bacterium RIFCSPHIGHO2_01_FULL_50_67]OGE90764.1 MAG: hypothetical protein A3E29_01405 [Candidatus Doudnabacteria bacterium RIFCSPHIGHO2_12_FULL_48_16]OGE97396.1 MAG: hypothetical protein A2990_01220 [Candidatus Doudnabacteria bacterium RIFCSPLOWO2_01_FULL_49_40]OGF03542.1 MAG: hypothetical protein A3H14_03600 [Candid